MAGLKPYLFALVGVIIFSVTLPATKIALSEVSPLFVFSARTVIAATLAAIWFWATRPELSDLKKVFWDLLATMLGTVVAFPLLTSFALQKTGASHGALVIALVPIFTAAISSHFFGTPRTRRFWGFAGLGTAIVVFTVIFQNKMSWNSSDSLLVLSALLVSIGYVFGVRASKAIGGIGTISCALILSIPFVLPLVLVSAPPTFPRGEVIGAILYLGVFSMFIGFVFWYKGLGLADADRVSLTQLLQLFFTYFFSALILKEVITAMMFVSAVAVMGCLAGVKLSK